MRTFLTAATLVALLAGGVASAATGTQTVLTSDSTLFAIDGAREHGQLEIVKRTADQRDVVVVPTTDDAAIESHARLAYDNCSNTLFVLYHRADGDSDDVRLAWMNADGQWTEPLVVATGTGRHLGLQLIQSHATAGPAEGEDEDGHTVKATILHAAWWTVAPEYMVPEYALIAFEGGEHVSTVVNNLNDLAAVNQADSETEIEDTGAAAHPPLTMVREGESVDVAFGQERSTAITRVKIDPRRVTGNARIWRPLGRDGGRTGPARMIAADSQPVQAFISKTGRVVLYTPDAQFRFVVHEGGAWTPLRMIELDETVTSDQMLQELRRTVDEHAAVEPQTDQEE